MDIARLGLQIDSSGVKSASRDLGEFEKEAKDAERASNKFGRGTKTSMAAAALATAGVAAAVATLGASLRAAEQYTGLTNAFKAMGQTGEEARQTLEDIGLIAKRTRAPLEATAKLYQRVSVAAKDIGATGEQVAQFTENVGKALSASGTSANEASGALLQLSQAMAGGVVRAEEFNSILEGAYPIAQAAANGIDGAAGSVGQLRKMVNEGKVSSKEFFDAILSQTVQLNDAFARTAPTVGQALSVVRTEFTLLSGKMNATLGITETIARSILFMGDNMREAAVYVGALATVITGTMVPSIYAAIAGFVTLRGVMMASGIGALVVAVGFLANKFIDLYNEAGSFAGAWKLAVDRTGARFTAIGHTVAAWGMNVHATALEASAALLRGFDEALSSVSQFFIDAATTAKAEFDTAVADIKAYILGIPEAAQAAMATFKGYIVGGITGTIADAVAAAGKLKNAVNKALTGMGADGKNVIQNAPNFNQGKISLKPLSQSGDASVEALKNYISGGSGTSQTGGGAGFDTLGIAAGKAYGEGLEKGVKDALGIQSPSKVGMLIGGDFSDGLEGGAGADTLGVRLGTDVAKGAAQGVEANISKVAKAAQSLEIKAGNLRASAIAHTHQATAAYVKLAKPIDAAAGSMDGLKQRTADTTPVVNTVSEATTAAAAQFKEVGSAGETAFEAIAKKAKGAASEVQKLNPILNSIFDAMGRGDLSNLGATIKGQLGSAFSGALQKAFTPGGGGIGGMFSGLFDGIKSLGGGGGLFSGGMSGLAGLTGGLKSGIAGIGGAISAAMPIIGGAMFLMDGFKKKTELLDAGLRININGTNALAESYNKVKETRFWGLSKKTKETFDGVSDAVNGALSDTVSLMQGGVLDSIAALGGNAAALDGFTASLKLSTKDMTEEQATAALTQELGKLSDEMALTALGTAEYTRLGETHSAALTRMSTAMAVVNPVLQNLGLRMFDVSTAGGHAASAFTDLVGGLDAFASKSQYYFNNFYSEALKAQISLNDVNAAFNAIGVARPQTIEEFKSFMDYFSSTGNTSAIAAMLNIAPTFKALVDYNNEVARKAKEAADAAAAAAAKEAADRAKAAAAAAAAIQVQAAKDAANKLLGRISESDYSNFSDYSVAMGRAQSASARAGNDVDGYMPGFGGGGQYSGGATSDTELRSMRSELQILRTMFGQAVSRLDKIADSNEELVLQGETV